jgi:hypothetical protein
MSTETAEILGHHFPEQEVAECCPSSDTKLNAQDYSTLFGIQRMQWIKHNLQTKILQISLSQLRKTWHTKSTTATDWVSNYGQLPNILSTRKSNALAEPWQCYSPTTHHAPKRYKHYCHCWHWSSRSLVLACTDRSQ